MHTCTLCTEFGKSYRREYRPDEFIEGNKHCQVLIIGLNPASEPALSLGELATYFDGVNSQHRYFRTFEAVSTRLSELLGKPGGVAHTDVVKCASTCWPPHRIGNRGAQTIIRNCKGYLMKQLESLRPKLIICNGSHVCSVIRGILPPEQSLDDSTAYTTTFQDAKVHVILSGFVGRLDNFAKRRLGKEVERYLDVIYGKVIFDRSDTSSR